MSRLKQPELAATLRRIADLGADDFYRGETARLLVEQMAPQQWPDHRGRFGELHSGLARAIGSQLARLPDNLCTSAKLRRVRRDSAAEDEGLS